MSSEEESNDLPSVAERSKRPDTAKPTGKHSVFHTCFQRSELRTRSVNKTTLAPCESRTEARRDRIHHPQNFRAAVSADQKVLKEESESCLQHRHAVVVQVLFLVGLNAKTAPETKILQNFRSETRYYSYK